MRRTRTRTRSRLLASTVLAPALALTLSGCLNQPEEANDNGPQEQPEQPAGVEQPEVVEEPSS